MFFYDMVRTGKLLPIQTSDNIMNPKDIEIYIDFDHRQLNIQ